MSSGTLLRSRRSYSVPRRSSRLLRRHRHGCRNCRQVDRPSRPFRKPMSSGTLRCPRRSGYIPRRSSRRLRRHRLSWRKCRRAGRRGPRNWLWLRRPMAQSRTVKPPLPIQELIDFSSLTTSKKLTIPNKSTQAQNNLCTGTPFDFAQGRLMAFSLWGKPGRKLDKLSHHSSSFVNLYSRLTNLHKR